jgi:glycerol-3-phosphate acyltransferase PlsY
MSLDPMAIGALLLSYVLGSIPTGLWLGLWIRKVDIREAGSKNIGATNTMRVLGKPLGAAALTGDVLKGLFPVIFFAKLHPESIHLPLLCGVAAILGHSFSLFLKFRGGKGVATSAGVFLGLVTWPTVLAVAIFAGIVAATRYVSLGSIFASISLAISVWFVETSNVVRVVVLLVALLIIVKHRANVQRILKGEENRV